MDSSLKDSTKPLVALACKDRSGKFHIIHSKEPLSLENFKEHEKMVQMGKIHFPHKWYDSIIICTEENLQELKRAL
ncbi:hypothetical protein KC480_05115 [Bacillus velezensis]|uniref:hypothetical protein n=1 Tax=Bacillus velezensis TaxID=492670 RepID=UPI001E41261C|nr:hypothetical protein [Bacillus velezensis]MCD7910904.1 hypothetical protein [Bacillus velezensis]